eukprot:3445893-Amphidinium_carterae.1
MTGGYELQGTLASHRLFSRTTTALAQLTYRNNCKLCYPSQNLAFKMLVTVMFHPCLAASTSAALAESRQVVAYDATLRKPRLCAACIWPTLPSMSWMRSRRKRREA